MADSGQHGHADSFFGPHIPMVRKTLVRPCSVEIPGKKIPVVVFPVRIHLMKRSETTLPDFQGLESPLSTWFANGSGLVAFFLPFGEMEKPVLILPQNTKQRSHKVLGACDILDHLVTNIIR